MPATIDPIKETHDVIQMIRDAWYDGRPIVPIIGAGFSAHSGFPILNSICRYLARFIYAIEESLLLPQLNSAEKLNAQIADIMKRAKKKPIEYLKLFNWPDRFDLTQKVAARILSNEVKGKSDHQRVETEITEKYGSLAIFSSSPRAKKEWDHRYETKSLGACGAWDRWALQGDWRRLIQFFTSFQEDQADALFASFGFLRSPGQGHRYLAHLTQLLSIQRLFTFNFDDLIERSLALEDVPYRLFGMEHGSTLPNPRVADDTLSVIKMHGSHHSILIDERLDRPLDPSYVERFYDLTGHDPLLLVLGCSGDDRRLEDLLEGGRKLNRETDLCWIHFEQTSPIPERIHDVYKEKHLRTCPTNSPALFLRHLLFDLSGRFSTSSRPYPSHPSTPMAFGKPDVKKAVESILLDPSDLNSFKSTLDIDSSEKLLDLATACANRGFAVIWIDVESLHTLAGVVGAIIDACRLIDPELPPAVMPVGDQKHEVAWDRLVHALQRHHYAVFIDAIGTYGSRALMHHSSSDEETAKKRAASFDIFLKELASRSLGQSIIVASSVTHASRRSSASEEILNSGDYTMLRTPDLIRGRWKNPLLWTCLSCIRRTRALPTVRRLLSPLIEGGLDNERVVDQFFQDAPDLPIRLLEGGDVWFIRRYRDSIYEHATRFSSSAMFQSLQEEKYAKFRALTLAQSILIAFLHRKLASTYFSFEFMQSRDAESFMEYTYHRISSIRYLSRAIYLVDKYGKADPKLIVDAFDFLQRIETPGSKFSWEEYFGPTWNELQEVKREHVLASLRTLREGDLQAFSASWKEHEYVVRSQIPAEQLIHWIREILDLPEAGKSSPKTANKSAEGLVRMSGVFVGSKYVPDKDKLTEERCAALKDFFSRLLLRIHVERGDFDAAIGVATKRQEEERSHQSALDLAEVCVRARSLDAAAKALKSLAKKMENLQTEDGHRFRHLKGLLLLGGTSWMAGAVNNDCVSKDSSPEEALKIAETGINNIRGHGALLAEPLDGMIVSAGSPGGAYCPYRSVFRAMKGRALIGRLLQATKDRPIKDDLADFRRAMRQFDQAKAGLSGQYAFLRAWADLHAAESSLLFVRRTFSRKILPNPEALGAIRAKLLRCRVHLNNGMNAVRLGRRNAIWWRHCYQLIAQYHAETLMWNFFKLAELRPHSASGLEESENKRAVAHGVEIFKRHEKCLDATTRFTDYSLNREEAFRDEWLKRVLVQTLTGTVLGVSIGECFTNSNISVAQVTRLVDDIIEDWKKRHARSYSPTIEEVVRKETLASIKEILQQYYQGPV